MALTVHSRPLTMISNDQVEMLHWTSMQILEEIGVEMLNDQALDILRHAGARVDWTAKRVCLSDEMVVKAVASAPPRFTLHARNPLHNCEIGGDTLALAPAGGPIMVSDLEGGRREGTYADQVNFIKLSQHSRLLDMAYRCVEAHDLPLAHRHLDYLQAAIRYSDKPLTAMSLGATRARDSIAMAAIVFGSEEQLRRTPVLLGGVNVDSPLRFSPETLETILTLAQAGQPLKITPFISTGVMTPVTLAGSLAQQNAEILAGITLAQLVNPGTPVVYGSFGTCADMRTAAPVFGSGEGVLMEVAAGQLAHRYQLPHRGMGLVTTAHSSDAQAAFEKMNSLWSLALSNTHLLLQAAGWLESGITASYEQFVLDLEMLESMEQFLAGFPVDEPSLALDTIAQVGPGGSYLMADHTLANFRSFARLSPLVDSRPYDAWQADGAPTLLERANRVWKDWLANYEAPLLDPSIEEAVRDYVERRKRGEPLPLERVLDASYLR